MTVFKRMIHVIMRVVRAAIVPDPLVAGSMYVRRFGMAEPIGKAGMFGRRRSAPFLRKSRRWTVCRNMPAAHAANGTSTGAAMLLRETRQ